LICRLLLKVEWWLFRRCNCVLYRKLRYSNWIKATSCCNRSRKTPF